MKKVFLSAVLLLGVAALPIGAFASNQMDAVSAVSTTGTYTGTLTTKMGTKTSTFSNFSLTYSNGTLYIPAFQIGSMPGTITVLATGLTEGVTEKCSSAVTLTLSATGTTTTYDANVKVEYNSSNKLVVAIDVLNPIYEGLSYVAEVDFVEN